MMTRHLVHHLRLLAGLALACAGPACHERDGERAAHAELRPPRGPPAGPAAHEPGGATVELFARHESGVPVHPAAGASEVSARLPGGTRVVVEAQTEDGRWLRIRARDGAAGWITRRYARGLDARLRTPSAAAPDSPWSSRASCQALLAARQLAARQAGTARIATWNLRWFPDGRPGYGSEGDSGTDLEWLACAITWLDVDLIAVQEVKTHARARERSQRLLAMLDAQSGGQWRLRVDDCPNEAGQHVGFLWNEKVVTAGAWTTLASLNPHGERCKDQLRPGLGAQFRFTSGLDVLVVSVHLKSGRERRSYELRRRSVAGLKTALAELRRAASNEDDVLVAGDLNSMGCQHCSPPITSSGELSTLEAEVASAGLRLVASSLGCSEYFEGAGVLLDHFLANGGMLELPHTRRSAVSGLCSDVRCDPLPANAKPAALTALSDHCPVVVQVDGVERD